MRYLIILLACVHLNATAQIWCPPGAVWKYGFESQQASGSTIARYVEDTLIDGMTYNRIEHTIYALQPNGIFGQAFVSALGSFYTRADEDVVYIRELPTDPDDTLMWFAAAPGDHWSVHGTGDTCVVADTGSYMLEGQQLRWLAVTLSFPMIDTLRERIGFDNIYLIPLLSMFFDFTTSGLMCYQDDLLIDPYIGPGGWAPCDLTVGLPHLSNETQFDLHPNPGTDHFTLHLPPGPHQITLFDAQGRLVLRQALSEERPVISTSSLPSGIYHLHVTDGHGRSSGHRWIKE